MSKNTLLSELINYVSANSSGNVTVAAPTSGVALTVNGIGNFIGPLNGMDATFTGQVIATSTSFPQPSLILKGNFDFGTIQFGNSANYNITAGADLVGMEFKVGGSQKMLIVDNGNVGINQSNPTFKLDVNGTGRFSGALSGTSASFVGGTGGLNFTSSTTITNTASSGFTAIYANGGGIYLGGSASVNHLSIAAGGAATFSSSVTAGGRIISGPGAYEAGGFVVPYSTASSASRNWKMTNDEVAFGDFTIKQSTTQTGETNIHRLYISPSGNVGIGTTAPNGKLDVIGDVRGYNFALTSDAVFRGGLYPYKFISGSGSDYGVTIFAEGGTGNGNIYFCPGGSATRAATITSGGNVLIGTTSNFSNLRLQVSGRIYTEGIVGYSYNQTSTSGTTSIVDTFIDNNSFGQSAMYMISYGGNPNAGGSGAYKTNYVGYISVATGWSGSNVTRYIRYTPVAQFDAPNVGALSLSVFFFNGSTETASINEQSTAGYYIRLKITGYNTSFVGSEQYVYLTRLN